MGNSEYCVVYVTAPNEEEALRIARFVVGERLAACANLIGQVRSIYHWEGKIHDEPEIMIVMKTELSAFEKLKAAILEMHSYDVPEIIALPIEAGHEPYLDWISESIGGDGVG